ncbi:spore coat protein [Herbaspirillum sp. meg3]|uniref:Csu type fimbrial protein n=1 Tax=Herbaspirillum sp. meg3 TaxID=2025949 RepID=UPI000B9989CF|nr:spore coat U domain-containing protein [Herbaspirillum sp. meg3]ASU38678.1 spore coat protein [Herbaspirillum sp. meg3]
MLTSNKNRVISVATAAILLASSAPVFASSTATGSLINTATVLASCTVVGSTIAFGNYTSSQVDQTGNVAVLCTNGTSYTIGLDAGAGTGATTTVRKLSGSLGGTLNYALYRDSGYTNNWGSTIGTDTQAGTGNGLIQNLTVYGRIAGSQTPLAGVYTDTVTVTLTY